MRLVEIADFDCFDELTRSSLSRIFPIQVLIPSRD